TSPEFYGEIISTRTYQDRLETLHHVRAAGINLCCGGIIGMGEKEFDRASLLRVLSEMNPHPESVPVNALVAVRGTPMEGRAPVDAFDMVRMIAVARIVMPRARVRLSAGRSEMSAEAQALCFMAGANSIFYGEKLLTTSNNDAAEDRALIARLGLNVQEITETPFSTNFARKASASASAAALSSDASCTTPIAPLTRTSTTPGMLRQGSS